MISIKVEYTVKESYAETNKKNIEKVMSDLRALENDAIQYSTFLKEDGVSFVHFAVYPDEETLKIVTETPSFKKFQSELLASSPVTAPVSERYTLVDSTYL